MTLKPIFEFGPIQGVRNVNFPLSRGVTPSVCSLSIPIGLYQLDRNPHTMIFSDGFRTVRFSGSVISDVQVRADNEKILNVNILDRRWRWQFGQVSGEYNIDLDGSLFARKTLPELMALALDACGETNYDLSRVPADVLPYVNWDMTRPDQALDELCKTAQCIPVLEDDRAVVYPDGVGGDLPKIPSSSVGEAFDFGVRPARVGVATAPMQWEFDMYLEPYGRELDGSYVPIDELSYRPKGGWIKAGSPTNLQNFTLNIKREIKVRRRGRAVRRVVTTELDLETVKRYAQSVYRVFRIRRPDYDEMPLTNLPLVAESQLRFLDNQVDTAVVKASGYASENQPVRRKDAQVFGQFYDEAGSGTNSTNEITKDFDEHPEEIYSKSFSIDQERGLVHFQDPVYYIGYRDRVPQGYRFPNIYLRTSVEYLSSKTNAAYRLEKDVEIDRSKGGTIAWESRNDVIPTWRQSADGQDIDNLSDVGQRLDYYIGYARQKYAVKNPGSGGYPMILPFSPDGVIAQVVFSIDGSGYCSTEVHRNIEGFVNVMSYERRSEKLALLRTLQRDQMQRNNPNARSKDIR